MLEIQSTIAIMYKNMCPMLHDTIFWPPSSLGQVHTTHKSVILTISDGGGLSKELKSKKWSLILTNYKWDISEDYYAMSYIISNPHSRTIWSWKGFRIHPHTAEKTTRFLFRGTFGHTVKCFDFTQIWSIFCVKIIIIFSRWSHWKLHPLVGIRVDPVPVMALQKNFGSLVLFGF